MAECSICWNKSPLRIEGKFDGPVILTLNTDFQICGLQEMIVKQHFPEGLKISTLDITTYV